MKAFIPVLFLAPSLAMASMPCAHEQRSVLQLDLDDIKVLQVAIGADKLRLTGTPDGDGRLSVRACASSQERLGKMSLTQERAGEGVLELVRETGGSSNTVNFSLFGGNRGNYGRFEIEGSIPQALAIELSVGSGDAWIHNVHALEAIVGSGDLEVRDVADVFTFQVGSGDVEARNVGRAQVRSIGSGDADLQRIGGNVSVGALGSGDIDVRHVGGDVTVRTKGSGDVSHRDVTGNVSVPRRR